MYINEKHVPSPQLLGTSEYASLLKHWNTSKREAEQKPTGEQTSLCWAAGFHTIFKRELQSLVEKYLFVKLKFNSTTFW